MSPFSVGCSAKRLLDARATSSFTFENFEWVSDWVDTAASFIRFQGWVSVNWAVFNSVESVDVSHTFVNSFSSDKQSKHFNNKPSLDHTSSLGAFVVFWVVSD